MNNYDCERNISTLKPEWVSIANAKQRKGRAGRVQPGMCYHLYTRAREMTMDEYQLPEILRTRLEEVILQIKILQLGDIVSFLHTVMNPPNSKVINNSIQLLQRLNALDANECLTPLGYHLSKLPMDPQTGKMVLMAAMFSCVEPVFSVAASLSFKDAFTVPLGKEKDVERCKLELSNGSNSDHVMMAEAYKQWEQAVRIGNSRQFCWDNYLNEHTLRRLRDMRKQFAEHLFNMKFLNSCDLADAASNINSENISLIKAVICAGLYPNVAQIRNIKTFRNRPGAIARLITLEDETVCIHPSSVNANQTAFESKYLLYHLKLQSTAIYLHDTTMIYPLPLLFFGDTLKIGIDNGSEYISVNNIKFKCNVATGDLILKLRKSLDDLLENKILHPEVINWKGNKNEEKLLRAISMLITIEDGQGEAENDDSD